ncbi:hypothetical protein [Nocardioides yefusunii]|uniref:Zinc-finger domain-containing protein n=1 Tax=Nocardioides yefusunii TaxID=2500546 RepID=A0ABW1QUA5_9ACTN|nr:hypothetical protein [Nocardioides yefusunii]
MIGHLGAKVTVLLDGRMSSSEEERAWDHVHGCHGCRDAVEREGWVKTHLNQWGQAAPVSTSDGLRAALLAAPFPYVVQGTVRGQGVVESGHGARSSATHAAGRTRHVVALGGSALGVAVMGLVALGAAPANTPFQERRTVTSIVPIAVTPSVTPAPGAATSTLHVQPLPGSTRATGVPASAVRSTGALIP